MKKPISARIDENVLQYIKSNGGKVNTLINVLLSEWMKRNQEKQLLAFQEETGNDELSQMKAKNDIKCNQCCKNCIYYNPIYIPSDKGKGCKKLPLYNRVDIKTFCCIYWEKKKGSR